MSDFQKMIVGAFVRHWLTAIAGALVHLGWIQTSETGSFVAIGAGIIVGAAGFLWSAGQKFDVVRRLGTLVPKGIL